MIAQLGGSATPTTMVASDALFTETITATDTDTWYRTVPSYEETTLASTSHGAKVKRIESGALLAFTQTSYSGATGTFTYTATIRALKIPKDTQMIFTDKYEVYDGNPVQVHKDNGLLVECAVIVTGPVSGGAPGGG